ncbi:hypothetical protein [Paenibacillus sp. Marseille-Q4541]|uniref:hypothetical protein n=1 Tax=Paenibacillus sp. Marseille-Q4541 TaxID=2831522 RepID=UPI001BA732B9|nr:hypothetical protein [Paenibacillus sp. Marseille-Q4541]
MAKLIITYHNDSYNEYHGSLERLESYVETLRSGKPLVLFNEMFDYEIRPSEVKDIKIVE